MIADNTKARWDEDLSPQDFRAVCRERKPLQICDPRDGDVTAWTLSTLCHSCSGSPSRDNGLAEFLKPPRESRREPRVASIFLPTHSYTMRVTRFVSLLLALAVAAISALWLANLAHNDFGVPRHTIRADSLLAALLVFGFLVIGLFSRRLGRRG